MGKKKSLSDKAVGVLLMHRNVTQNVFGSKRKNFRTCGCSAGDLLRGEGKQSKLPVCGVEHLRTVK